MSENEKTQIQSQEEKPQTPAKQIIISFEYRRTGMGGMDDTIILSFKSKKVIKSRLHTSRTGAHGERTYVLFPAIYLLYIVKRSDLGNTYITVSIARLKEDRSVEKLQEWNLYEGKKPKMAISQLPKNIVEILYKNKDELPLFKYVEDQDLISQ